MCIYTDDDDAGGGFVGLTSNPSVPILTCRPMPVNKLITIFSGLSMKTTRAIVYTEG